MQFITLPPTPTPICWLLLEQIVKQLDSQWQLNELPPAAPACSSSASASSGRIRPHHRRHYESPLALCTERQLHHGNRALSSAAAPEAGGAGAGGTAGTAGTAASAIHDAPKKPSKRCRNVKCNKKLEGINAAAAAGQQVELQIPLCK